MGSSKLLDFKSKVIRKMTCPFSGFSGSLEQMSTFASTYMNFPSKVAEIAILGWGGGVYCFAGGLLFTPSGYFLFGFASKFLESGLGKK